MHFAVIVAAILSINNISLQITCRRGAKAQLDVNKAGFSRHNKTTHFIKSDRYHFKHLPFASIVFFTKSLEIPHSLVQYNLLGNNSVRVHIQHYTHGWDSSSWRSFAYVHFDFGSHFLLTTYSAYIPAIPLFRKSFALYLTFTSNFPNIFLFISGVMAASTIAATLVFHAQLWSDSPFTDIFLKVAVVGGGHSDHCGVTVHSMTYSSHYVGRWSPWRLWSDNPFNDIFKSLWWAVVTLTTVEWQSIQWHIQVAMVGGGHPNDYGATVHSMTYSSRYGGRWSP